MVLTRWDEIALLYGHRKCLPQDQSKIVWDNSLTVEEKVNRLAILREESTETHRHQHRIAIARELDRENNARMMRAAA